MAIRIGKNEAIISFPEFLGRGNNRSPCFFHLVFPIVNFLLAVRRKREYHFISVLS